MENILDAFKKLYSSEANSEMGESYEWFLWFKINQVSPHPPPNHYLHWAPGADGVSNPRIDI